MMTEKFCSLTSDIFMSKTLYRGLKYVVSRGPGPGRNVPWGRLIAVISAKRPRIGSLYSKTRRNTSVASHRVDMVLVFRSGGTLLLVSSS
jgi:hypothetical protein